MKIKLNEILTSENILMPLIHFDWADSYLSKKEFIDSSIKEHYSEETSKNWILRLEYSAGIWLIDSWRRELGPIKDWVVKKDLKIYTLENELQEWHRLKEYEKRLTFLKNSLETFGLLYIPKDETRMFDIYGKSNLIRRNEYLSNKKNDKK